MIYILLAILIGLLIISYLINRRDITAPAVLFSTSFVLAIGLACIFSNYLGLELHSNTFYVISTGVVVFLISSSIAHVILRIVLGKTKTKKREVCYININNNLEIAFIFVEIITLVLSCYALLRIMGSDWGSLLTSIHIYRENTMHKGIEMESFPSYVKLLRVLVSSSGYWFTYVIMQNYSLNKKVKIREIIIVFLSMLSSIVTGGRGVAIYYILSGLVLFFYTNKNYRQKRKERIQVWKLVLIGVIFFALFVISGNLIGRNIKGSYARYFVLYCGAEIKNLDTFLQGAFPTSTHFAQETFITFYRSYGSILGLPLDEYVLYHPFRYVGTVYLGNVSTIFQAFISDFGYVGVISMTAIMAFISQFFYECANREKPGKRPNMIILIYCFVAAMLFFSFFSNKFYEELLSKGLIQNIICWIVMNYVFLRIRVRSRSRVRANSIKREAYTNE